MSYLPVGGPPPFDVFQSFENPWGAGGPGALIQPPRGVTVGPTMPYGLFPTQVSWGDVVNVTGDFRGQIQGQVRVKFQGAPWMAPSIQGPFAAAVTVPEGAESGECAIEVNGRRVFGANCVVTKRTGAQAAMPTGQKDFPTWHNFGPKSVSGVADAVTQINLVTLAIGGLIGVVLYRKFFV